MIEILLATYNGSEYIEEQINSILSQTFKEWHLTIRDDFSTDDTYDKLLEFQGMYPEKIKVLEDRTASKKACFNFMRLTRYAMENVDAPFYMFCDQDDVWEPDKIEQTFNMMKKMSRKYGENIPLLVHTDLFVVDENLSIISPSFMRYTNLDESKNLCDLLIMNSVVGCTIMVNRCLLEMFSKAPECDRIHMHDHFMALIAATYGKIGYVKCSTIKYRQHNDNSMGAADAASFTHKIKRFANGSKHYKEDVMLTYKQVGLLLELYENENPKPDEKIVSLLHGYAELENADKLKRIKFYIKYKILKKGFSRCIFQLLWA